MADPTALFKQYEAEYCNKSTDISRKISALASLSGGACVCLLVARARRRRRLVRARSALTRSLHPPQKTELRRKKASEAEADIRDADATLKRLDMEARSLSVDLARPLALKVKEYKADLSALREQLKAAGAGSAGDAAARAELGLGGEGDYYSSSAGQRERMLAATERLQKTSDRLQTGKQQLAETEVRFVCLCVLCCAARRPRRSVAQKKSSAHTCARVVFLCGGNSHHPF